MRTSEIQTMVIDASGSMTLDIDQDARYLIQVRGDQPLQLELTVTVKPDVEATLLWVDQAGGPVSTKQLIHVNGNAALTMAYAELTRHAVTLDAKICLEEAGAEAQIRTATIAADAINYNIQCVHAAPHTQGVMENYGVVLQGAKVEIVANGTIGKGMSGSRSHQTSRFLTFDNQQSVKIIPMLLIDENDVEASHAMSLGQPDENQLYYMQSRGLSRDQAIQVIAAGYLMPIGDVLEDDTLKQQLQEEIEQKVQSICLM